MSAASQPLGRAVPAWRSYVELTKPRILPLVLFTGLPAMVLAGGGWPSLADAAVVLFGIALAAAAANVLNMYVERDRDRLMERTRTRPLPTGAIGANAALVFGLALGAAGTALLWWWSGPAAAGLSVASILFYVFVYTIWLKPRSVYNAVIGGAAGAAAPLIADVAVNGTIGWPGLVLFGIVFLWQPPHVWAIALYRGADYAAAGIPMMPAVVGAERTYRRMIYYTLGLIPVTFAPVVLGWVGAIYGASAVALNGWFVWSQVRLMREQDDAAARRVFFTSLAYLFALFLALLADLAVAGPAA